MTKELKDFLLSALFITVVGSMALCALFWASKGMEYSDSGETRVLEKVFADGRIEYVPQKKRESQFSSYWIQIDSYYVSTCSKLYRLTFKGGYKSEDSLNCAKKVIDVYLSSYESNKVVKENYIKYPQEDA